jgi:2-hydroxychromene-2-carboxylate isomerase
VTTIEYVYSAHSAYAYLGGKAFMDIAKAANATIVHKPIILSPVIAAQAAQPRGKRPPTYNDYFFGREIERWAEYRGVECINHIPSKHSADYRLASGMIIALGQTGDAVDKFAYALMRAHWVDDIDLSDQTALAQVAQKCGHDADELLARGAAPEVQAQLQANTDWAISKNVFGSPTYIVDGDPFYGQDHLELVKRALEKPFAPTSWAKR